MMRAPYMRGLTLVETVVVLGIFLAITAILAVFFLRFNSFFGYQSAVRDTAGSANTALDQMHTALLQATRVAASHTFSGTAYTSGTNVLVLQIPSIDASGNIIVGANDYEAFYATGAALYHTIDANPSSSRVSRTQKISSTVSTLSFTYDSADFSNVTTVTALLNTSENNSHTTATGHGTITVRLRNF